MRKKMLSLVLALTFVLALGATVFAASGTYSGITWTTSSTCTTSRAYVCMTSNKATELQAYSIVSYKRNGYSTVLTTKLNPYGESTTRISDVCNAGSMNTLTCLYTRYWVKGYEVYSDTIYP